MMPPHAFGAGFLFLVWAQGAVARAADAPVDGERAGEPVSFGFPATHPTPVLSSSALAYAIERAVQRSPAVRAAHAAVDAAAGAAADAAGLQHNPNAEARLGFGVAQHELSLTQPLARGGAGAAARAAASARAQAAEAALELARIDAAWQARNTLLDAIVAERQRALCAQILDLTTVLRASAEAERAAGAGSDLAIHLARLDHGAAWAALLDAQLGHARVRRSLAQDLGIDVDAVLPADPMAVVPPPAPGRADMGAAVAAAAAKAAQAEAVWVKAAARPPVALGMWAQAQDLAAVTGDVQAWSAPMALSLGPVVSVEFGVAHRQAAARAEAQASARTAQLHADAAAGAAQADAALGQRLHAARSAADTALDPQAEALAALAALAAAVEAGQMSAAEAAPLRQRVWGAWAQADNLRAAQARAALAQARAEAWPTLVPAAAEPSGAARKDGAPSP